MLLWNFRTNGSGREFSTADARSFVEGFQDNYSLADFFSFFSMDRVLRLQIPDVSSASVADISEATVEAATSEDAYHRCQYKLLNDEYYTRN